MLRGDRPRVGVVRSVNPLHPDPSILIAAAECLRSGGLVAFPTESYYGLGVIPTSESAVKRLFAVKERPLTQAVALIVADRAQLLTVVESISPLAEQLIEKFWPGPLTLVLPVQRNIPKLLTGGSGRIGARQPAMALLCQLVKETGAPITATSANRSGAQAPTTAQAVNEQLGQTIDLILDGGQTPGGLPSTVLDVVSDPPVVIREGAVSVDQLRTVCPTIP